MSSKLRSPAHHLSYEDEDRRPSGSGQQTDIAGSGSSSSSSSSSTTAGGGDGLSSPHSLRHPQQSVAPPASSQPTGAQLQQQQASPPEYSSNSSSYSSSSSSSRPQLSSGNTSPPDHQQQHSGIQAAPLLQHFSSPEKKSGREVVGGQGAGLNGMIYDNSSGGPHSFASPSAAHPSASASASSSSSSMATGSQYNHGQPSSHNNAIGSQHFHPQQSHQNNFQPQSSSQQQHQHHQQQPYANEAWGRSNGMQMGPAAKSRRTSPGGSRIADGTVGAVDQAPAAMSADNWMHAGKHALSSSAPSASSLTMGPPSAANRIANASPASQHAHTATTPSSASASGSQRRPKLDLARYPAQDLLKVLATLLHQVSTANDQLRPKGGNGPTSSSGSSSGGDRRHRSGRARDVSMAPESAMRSLSHDGSSLSASHSADSMTTSTTSISSSTSSSPARRKPPTTAAMSALSTPSSTLCFHARNVPSISIESYLLRILKYCPTTNEVFLSLIIYFDRMSKMGAAGKGAAAATSATEDGRNSGNSSMEGQQPNSGTSFNSVTAPANGGGITNTEGAENEDTADDENEPYPGMRGFAIDSYNVHRLVIAGVTVASKFFSDVFYTNSRYAKVGGLPVHELNQLELQFLLLNDFSLVIPLEEMQRYADQLLVYGGAASASTGSLNSTLVDPSSQ